MDERGFTLPRARGQGDEDRPGGAPVVMLSWGLWQSRYGGDAAMLGRTIRLDGVSRRVVSAPRDMTLVLRTALAGLI